MISIQSKPPNTPCHNMKGALDSDLSTSNVEGFEMESYEEHAIIGAPEDDLRGADGLLLSNAGSAYIYEQHVDENWVKTHKIIASDRDNNDLFGWSVASEGKLAIVGAPQEDHDSFGKSKINDSGAAYIFEKDAMGNWNQKQKIVASNRTANMQFGMSVSISNKYIIVGAYKTIRDSSSVNIQNPYGSAHIFEKDSKGNWYEVQKIVAENKKTKSVFGHLVSISENQAMIGSTSVRNKDGLFSTDAINIYERNDEGHWNLKQSIPNPRQTFRWLEKLY